MEGMVAKQASRNEHRKTKNCNTNIAGRSRNLFTPFQCESHAPKNWGFSCAMNDFVSDSFSLTPIYLWYPKYFVWLRKTIIIIIYSMCARVIRTALPCALCYIISHPKWINDNDDWIENGNWWVWLVGIQCCYGVVQLDGPVVVDG